MKDTNRLARIIGNIIGVTLALCALSVIVALTIKLVLWII